MRILIIGGTGFIGRHLVAELQDAHELCLFHRGQRQVETKSSSLQIAGDRKHLFHFRKQFREFNPDVVVDVIPYFAQDAWDVVHTFRQICKRIIAISSGDVYRAYEIFKDKLEDLQQGALSEQHPLRRTLFPYRKQAQDNYLLNHYEKILVEHILMHQQEFDSTIFRPGALYGPHDSQRKLKEYVEPMLTGQKQIAISPDKAQWKWTRGFVKDIVKGISLAVEKEHESRNEIFNLGEKNTLSQMELINMLRTLTNWPGKINLNEKLKEDPCNYRQHMVLDTSKIRRKLGYEERYTLEDGLRQTIKFEQSVL